MLGVMGYLCGSTCKRKTGKAYRTCRTFGKTQVVAVDASGKPVKPDGKHPQATPHEKGAAVDMYYEGLSYRRTAENMEQYFGGETGTTSVYCWVRELSAKADEILRPMKVTTGDSWVADEMVGYCRICWVVLPLLFSVVRPERRNRLYWLTLRYPLPAFIDYLFLLRGYLIAPFLDVFPAFIRHPILSYSDFAAATSAQSWNGISAPAASAGRFPSRLSWGRKKL